MLHPPSQQLPSKDWDPVKPLFENLVGASPSRKVGGAHYVTWISLKIMNLNTKLGKKHVSHPRQISLVGSPPRQSSQALIFFWFPLCRAFHLVSTSVGGIIAKNCMKITKSKFWGKNNGKHRGQANFWCSGGIPPSPPPPPKHLVKPCFSKFRAESYPSSRKGRGWYCAPHQFYLLVPF